MTLLTDLGGNINIPDTFIGSAEFREILADLPPIRLAFNGTGGSHVTDIARVLAPNATLGESSVVILLNLLCES